MYRHMVRSRLEVQMQGVQSRTDQARRWPVGTILLGAPAATALAVAIGAFAMRERLQARLTSLAAETCTVEETPT